MTAARIDELRAKFEDNPRRYFAPLANEYRKAGDLTQAIALCREFLPNQPGHMSGHIVYGQALFETGELDEARTVFETALELDPENLIALRHLGDIAKARHDLGAAKRWYERVLEADPRNDDIASQLAALAAQRRTPMSVPAIPEPVAVAAPPVAPVAQPLLDDELLVDVARMVQPVDAAPPEAEPEPVTLDAITLEGPVEATPASPILASASEWIDGATSTTADADPSPAGTIEESIRPFARTPAWTPTMSAFMQEQAALEATVTSADDVAPLAEFTVEEIAPSVEGSAFDADAASVDANVDVAGMFTEAVASASDEGVVESLVQHVDEAPVAASSVFDEIDSAEAPVSPVAAFDVVSVEDATAAPVAAFDVVDIEDAPIEPVASFIADDIDAAPIAPVDAFVAAAPLDEAITDDVTPIAPLADDVTASAAALTQALDAFATWDVGAPSAPTSDDEAALASAWPDSEASAAEVHEAAPIAETEFEAGFFVPEWPSDLSAVGPKTPTTVDAVAELDVDARVESPVMPDASVETDALPADEAVVAASSVDYATDVLLESDREDIAVTTTDHPPVVDIRQATDPWISVVAANDASSDFAPVAPTPPAAVHTVESVAASASTEQDVPRLDGLETMDDAMGIRPLAEFVVSEDEGATDAWGVDASVEPEPVVSALIDASDARAESEPIATETLAELYVAQGLTDRAIGVYRTLIATRPDDAALLARLAELEAPAAPAIGRTAGEWFAELAARRVVRRTPMHSTAVPAEPGVEHGLAAIFGEDTAPTDELAASVWSQAFTPPSGQDTSDLFASAADDAPSEAAMMVTSAAPRATPRSVPASNAGFSFDQFFATEPAPPPSNEPTTSAGAPPKAPAEDLARFADWLRGLAG